MAPSREAVQSACQTTSRDSLDKWFCAAGRQATVTRNCAVMKWFTSECVYASPPGVSSIAKTPRRNKNVGKVTQRLWSCCLLFPQRCFLFLSVTEIRLIRLSFNPAARVNTTAIFESVSNWRNSAQQWMILLRSRTSVSLTDGGTEKCSFGPLCVCVCPGLVLHQTSSFSHVCGVEDTNKQILF